MMIKAPDEMTFDHLRQLWLSIIGTRIKEHLTMEKQTVFKHYYCIKNTKKIRSSGRYCIQMYAMTRNEGA